MKRMVDNAISVASQAIQLATVKMLLQTTKDKRAADSMVEIVNLMEFVTGAKSQVTSRETAPKKKITVSKEHVTAVENRAISQETVLMKDLRAAVIDLSHNRGIINKRDTPKLSTATTSMVMKLTLTTKATKDWFSLCRVAQKTTDLIATDKWTIDLDHR